MAKKGNNKSNKPMEYKAPATKSAVEVEESKEESFGAKDLEKTAEVVENIESGETEPQVSFEVNEGKASLDVELTNEELTAKVTQFNRAVLRNKWKSKDMLVDFAKKELGGDVEAIQGLNMFELTFMFKGVRVPTEGVYHIRPRG